MRDKNKNEQYFKNFIKRKENQLNEFVQLLQTEQKTNGVPSNNTAYKMFKTSIEFFNGTFSIGADLNTLKSTFQLVLTPLNFISAICYRDVLNVLAIGVLLDVNPMDNIKHLLPQHLDDFLGLFTEVFTKEQVIGVDKDIIYPYVLLYLNIVLTQNPEEAKEVLTDYLNLDWYMGNDTEYWYNNLNSNNDSYFGYWSFEAMALAKIYKVDSKELEEVDYFSSL